MRTVTVLLLLGALLGALSGCTAAPQPPPAVAPARAATPPLSAPPRCRSYELYAASPGSGGAWRAGSGAVFDLRGNRLRPAGWTSADAAGLSILAGLVRYAEVAAGHIDHAIRITVPRSRAAY